MKQKLKEKYLPNSYKWRLLDRLHSLRLNSRSVKDYTIEFDDLTLRREVREDSYQAISRYRYRLRSDIQRVILIHSLRFFRIETLEQASQLAQDTDRDLP